MIVSEDDVSSALSYLAEDPHPIALARKDLTDAINRREATYAELFGLMKHGTIKEKECAVERDSGYLGALKEESTAIMELERHKARVRAAEMLIEVWRSEQANTRTAERIR